MIPPLVRRVVKVVTALTSVLALVGATYQGVATAVERRQFPRPGQLVSVGDHQLHLYCTGEGSPTVLLEAPALGMSVAWAWVQSEIAFVTRVCSYDRAGLGWSESDGRAFDPTDVPNQLHALLVGAAVEPPYLIAAQGLGAAFAVLFAGHYPAETAGLVLVDPPREGAPPSVGTVRLIRFSPWLARIGLLRAAGVLSTQAEHLPGDWGGAFAAFLNRPDHLTRAGVELAGWREAVARSAAVSLPPHLPVVRVDTGDRSPTAFPASREEADRIARAITDVVRMNAPVDSAVR